MDTYIFCDSCETFIPVKTTIVRDDMVLCRECA